MVFRESPLAAVAADYRGAQSFGESYDLIGPAAVLHLLSHQYDGPSGHDKRFDSPLYHVGVALGHLDVPGRDQLHVGFFPQQVGGNLQLDGSGPAGTEALERLLDVVGDGLDAVD